VAEKVRDRSGGQLENALENSIQEWRWFLKYSAPGCRFRDRYRRRQQTARDRSMLRRICYVAFGVAIALGSLLLAPLPGPGWGTFFVGLGIVAGEVFHVARLLDRGEVKLREALQLTRGMWDKSAPTVRVLIALTISLCVAASVFGVHQMLSLASLAL
jgi:Putative transmembrane protein (PGPGW)